MGARRFFVAQRHDVGDRLTIEGSDAHKIVDVLRLRTGDEVEIADSTAQVFSAKLQIDGSAVRAQLCERIATGAHWLRVDVAQAVPKGAKMDFVVEKLSELGVTSILPITSERTIVRDVGEGKLDRWRRLARAAAAQSGRADVATIAEPLDYGELLVRFTNYDAVVFPWELADGRPLRETLPPLVAEARSILVVIGPEGGFSHAEAELAKAAGAAIVSLGSQILRTETAALVLLSVLRYLIL